MYVIFFLLVGCVSAWFGGEVNYTPHSDDEHDVDEGELLNITEVNGFPTPSQFIYEILDTRHLLVIKEGITDSPAYYRWIDDSYFTSMKGTHNSDDMKIDSTYFKQDGFWDYFTHDLYMEGGDFSKFVENYRQKDQAIASFLPSYLLRDITVPCGIRCDDFTKDTLYRPVIWMANSKLATKIHTDVGDNIICSLRGELNFTLFENKDRKKLRLVKGYNMISDIVSPSHDFGSDVKSRGINISRGDCFFIPSNTSYSVTSNTNTIAVSIMWKKICHHMIKMDNCDTRCGSNPLMMTEVKFYDYTTTIKEVKDIQRLVIPNHEEFVGTLKNTANFDLEKEEDGKLVLSFADVVFSILDRDGDKRVSDEEIAKTPLQDWLKFGERNRDLNLLLRHYMINHEPPPTRNRIEL